MEHNHPAPPDLNINYHYHFHEAPGSDVVEAVTALRIGTNALALAINQLEDKVSLDLGTLTNELSETKGVVASVVAFIQALIAELQANSGNQAAVDAIAQDLSDTTDQLAAAIATEPTP